MNFERKVIWKMNTRMISSLLILILFSCVVVNGSTLGPLRFRTVTPVQQQQQQPQLQLQQEEVKDQNQQLQPAAYHQSAMVQDQTSMGYQPRKEQQQSPLGMQSQRTQPRLVQKPLQQQDQGELQDHQSQTQYQQVQKQSPLLQQKETLQPATVQEPRKQPLLGMQPRQLEQRTQQTQLVQQPLQPHGQESLQDYRSQPQYQAVQQQRVPVQQQQQQQLQLQNGQQNNNPRIYKGQQSNATPNIVKPQVILPRIMDLFGCYKTEEAWQSLFLSATNDLNDIISNEEFRNFVQDKICKMIGEEQLQQMLRTAGVMDNQIDYNAFKRILEKGYAINDETYWAHFKEADRDHDEKITYNQMPVAYRHITKEMFDYIDADRDGLINYQEFLNLVTGTR